jgi:sialate O-acetylesterase
MLSALLLSSGSTGRLHASDWPLGDDAWKRIVKLNGDWKFSVGDSADWAAPEFADRDWTTIHAPAEWQSQGYRDYNGFAWYRKTFAFPDGHEKDTVFLSLGKVDDVDQVYLNGKLIGSTGQFPPHYLSAYDEPRIYEVPSGSLVAGRDNVLAVRVYDGGGVGGIVEGRLCFFTTDIPQPEIVLSGIWKFSPGDNAEWKQEHCDETGFAEIPVPAYWENAGYPQLDGYAWYRKTFTVSAPPPDKTLVLMLGKIDDFDAVYLNGTLIGSTGPVDHPKNDDGVAHYAQNRGYFFPSSLLKGTNTIAVRVYDRYGPGGIYSSPVGIISQAAYIKYWEARKTRTRSFWRLLEVD